jgi:hypothetical protein
VLFLLPFATPTPTPSAEFNPDAVTPGPVGFIVMFLIAVAVVFLVIDMTRRIRRVRYRDEIREKLELERLDASAESDSTQK